MTHTNRDDTVKNMKYKQLEFEFRSPEEIDKINQEIKKSIEEYDQEEYFRINKYADWWCSKVPRWLGWGIYDGYNNTILWFKSTYQKLRYGVSDQECWNLSNTFAEYMLPRLKHFRNMNRKGVPCLMYDVPVYVHDNDTKVMDKCKIAEDKWNAILDEIIWTFEYMVDSEKFNPIPDTKPFRKQINSSSADSLFEGLFEEKTPEEKLVWDAYFERSEKFNERKNKGLQLFATYFDNLWD